MYQTLLSNFLYAAAAIYSCMFPKNEALQISLHLIDVLLCVHYVLVNELYIFCAGNHVCYRYYTWRNVPRGIVSMVLLGTRDCE